MESKVEDSKEDADSKTKDTKEIVDDDYSTNPNLMKVQFRTPHAKNIVSPHSSSILAQSEPIVDLSFEAEREAREKYAEFVQVQIASVVAAQEAAAAAANAKPGKAPAKGKGPVVPEPEPLPPPPQAIGNDVNKIHKTRIGELLQIIGYKAKIDFLNVSAEKRYTGPDDVGVDDFVEFIRKFQAPPFQYGQRLRRYANRGQTADVLDLVARGCTVNTADGEGLTALHYAAQFGKAEIVEALRDISGEVLIVDAKDKQGWTPLYAAVHHGSERCVELLLEMGAQHGVTNNFGKTPLHAAASQGRLTLCNLLLSAGAVASVTDNQKFTPLHDAAFKGHVEVFDALSQAESADLNIRDKLGNLASNYLTDFAADAKEWKEKADSHQLHAVPQPEVTFHASVASTKDGGGGGGLMSMQSTSDAKSGNPQKTAQKKSTGGSASTSRINRQMK